MVFHSKNFNTRSLLLAPSVCFDFLHSTLSASLFHTSFSTVLDSSTRTGAGEYDNGEGQDANSQRIADLNLLVSRVKPGSSEDDVFLSLLHDKACDAIEINHNLLDMLLHRYKDDWKSAWGVFRWAKSRPGFEPAAKSYDMLVDILGKMKKMGRMRIVLEEMGQGGLVTYNTIAKVMRRFAGAGEWEHAVRTFDELEGFGLEKNTESMNLLLDTLCKEGKVEPAREIFLVLKAHVKPDAHTFNIFIHGWCKANRVEEAHWTIQEMKGHGCRPCVISYSTIIQSYCRQSNFRKVNEILDEMQAQGCPPNVVTYTSVMCSLTRFGEYEEALQIAERVKQSGCEPDTLFYNALIHTLGKAGRVEDAVHVFEVEMPSLGVSPNISTYNSMIAMFCNHYREKNALDILREVENSPYYKPDLQTYNPLLKLCFKSGKTDHCLSKLLEDMVYKHHLSLDLSTYTLLIHGLCRENEVEQAYLLFQEMIGREIIPRHDTCRFLLEEMKQKNRFDAADKIEDFMKQKKTL